MQSRMQNFSKPTIYPSFMNNSFNPQLDTTFYNSSNVNDVQGGSVALNNISQVSTMTPIIMPLTTPPNINVNQASNIQDMTPSHALQPMQDYQQLPNPSLLAHSQETVSVNSFFYTPCNDFQMYHIICKEISFNFESVSQLISNTNDNLMNNYVQSNNIFVFYHEQPEIKKIYQVTCEMVSHTFLFQYLNRIIYNIQFVNCEHQQQEFSKRHQENLIFHLKKDLIHYLIPNNIYEDNYNMQKRFIQDYRTYESMVNSNTYVPNHFQQYNSNEPLPFDQSYISQRNNNCQIVSSRNYGN
jgi:hypothetical protein